mmetsp:Transcript_36254/g.58038  ORF Transcript_36254/g.58038 Transcript_36254/m.58038 type:complete len:624 (+) Transcript_36254:101-1972(+)
MTMVKCVLFAWAALIAPVSASMCTAPVQNFPGCFSASSILSLAQHLGEFTSNQTKALNGIYPANAAQMSRPVIGHMMSSKIQAGAQAAAKAVPFNLCLATATGAELKTQAKYTMDSCQYLNLDPTSTYNVLSFDIPAILLAPIVPGLANPVQGCAVVSVCKPRTPGPGWTPEVPMVGFAMNAGMIEALANNDATDAATFGISGAFGIAAGAAVRDVAFALSPASAVQKAVTIWDGSSVKSHLATGQLQVAAAFDLSPQHIFGPSFPYPGLFSITLAGDMVAQASTLSTATTLIDGVVATISNKKPKSSLTTELLAALRTAEVAMTVNAGGVINLSNLTQNKAGALLPSINLPAVNATIVATGGPNNSLKLPTGLYMLVQQGLPFISFLRPFVIQIGAHMSPLFKMLFGQSVMPTIESAFAAAANAVNLGIIVNTLGAGFRISVLNTVEIHCMSEYNTPQHITSCHVHVNGISKFVSLVKSGAYFIAREAAALGQLGNTIIAAVDTSLGLPNGAPIFTPHNIQQTAKAIAAGAASGVAAVDHWAIAHANYAWCGATNMANAAVCGVSHLVGWVECAASSGTTYAKEVFNCKRFLPNFWAAGNCIKNIHAPSCSVPQTCPVANKC